MKRKIKWLILILPLFIILGCETKTYPIEEISSVELYNSLASEDITDFVFAIYNDRLINSEEFLENLQLVANRNKIKIYYMNYNHMVDDLTFYFVDYMGYSSEYQLYGSKVDGGLGVLEYYTDYNTLLTNLRGAPLSENVSYLTEDEKTSYIEQADKYYDNNQYAQAIDTLNYVYPDSRAVAKMSNLKYYNFCGIWEGYEFTDSEYKIITYRSLILYSNYNIIGFYEEKNATYEKYEKPDYDEYTDKYYKIEDDTIYFSDTEDGKYKATYKITKLTSEKMVLTELSTNKTLYLQRKD